MTLLQQPLLQELESFTTRKQEGRGEEAAAKANQKIFSDFTYKTKEGFEGDCLPVKSDSQPKWGCQTSCDTLQSVPKHPQRAAPLGHAPGPSRSGEARRDIDRDHAVSAPACSWLRAGATLAPQAVPEQDWRRRRYSQQRLCEGQLAPARPVLHLQGECGLRRPVTPHAAPKPRSKLAWCLCLPSPDRCLHFPPCLLLPRLLLNPPRRVRDQQPGTGHSRPRRGSVRGECQGLAGGVRGVSGAMKGARPPRGV